MIGERHRMLVQEGRRNVLLGVRSLLEELLMPWAGKQTINMVGAMESSCPSTKDKHCGRGSKEKSQGPRVRSCSLYVLTASF